MLCHSPVGLSSICRVRFTALTTASSRSKIRSIYELAYCSSPRIGYQLWGPCWRSRDSTRCLALHWSCPYGCGSSSLFFKNTTHSECQWRLFKTKILHYYVRSAIGALEAVVPTLVCKSHSALSHVTEHRSNASSPPSMSSRSMVCACQNERLRLNDLCTNIT